MYIIKGSVCTAVNKSNSNIQGMMQKTKMDTMSCFNIFIRLILHACHLSFMTGIGQIILLYMSILNNIVHEEVMLWEKFTSQVCAMISVTNSVDYST